MPPPARRRWPLAVAGLGGAAVLIAGWLWFGQPAALEVDPGTLRHFNTGVEKLREGSYTGARLALMEAVRLSPVFVQAHLNLGIALYADGDREAADASLRLALESAQNPEQKAQVEKVIALAQRQPAESGNVDGKSPPANASNASTAFQREAEAALRRHPVVGPKIESVRWDGAAQGVVSVCGFPMDAMPPVVRNKFKSRMNEELSALAERESIDATLRIELVDADSTKVMDALDGKEWVGAFVYLARGEAPGAVRTLAPFIDPAMTAKYETYVLAAQALRRARALDDAVAALERAVTLYGVNAVLMNLTGECLAELGKVPEALAAFEKALELSPDQPAVRAKIDELRKRK